MRRLCAFLALMVLSGCSEPPGTIRAIDYGDRWPFTVDSGVLECAHEGLLSARSFVTLDTGDGIKYGLNGSARSFGYPDAKDILKPGKTGADLQSFIDVGLKLCPSR